MIKVKGWTIREREGTVSVYHDVFCPHGECVDVINISREPIRRGHLVEWVNEYSKDYAENACPYH